MKIFTNMAHLQTDRRTDGTDAGDDNNPSAAEAEG